MKRMIWTVVAGGALAALAAPVAGQRAQLAMLNQIEGGRWELRIREPEGGVQQLCINDGRRLIQLRHPALACESTVLSDSNSEVTVQYVCRGRGYGRTHIRRESGRLIQLDTQGIANGLPFAFSAEGRRVGECSS